MSASKNHFSFQGLIPVILIYLIEERERFTPFFYTRLLKKFILNDIFP